MRYFRKNPLTVLLFSTILMAGNPLCAASNNAIMDKLEFSKADSIISDKVFYSIGGGAGYMAPPSRGRSNVVDIGIGWKANLMCGNFDIKTTVKNQLNGITEGFKDLMSNVIESATGAVASLPAMAIQRANPQLYDLMTNGVFQGKLDFNRLKTSCEEMSRRLADYTLGGQWNQAANLSSFKDISATEPDANKAQKKLEEDNGEKGSPWVGGQNKGGKGQEAIKIVEDVVKAGYNQLNHRSATEKNAISSTNCAGLLCQTWKTPQEAADWLTKVVGEKAISTCKTSCSSKTGASPGTGLSPEIEEEHIRSVTQLQTVLNASIPTVEMLAELSSTTVPVTRGLIESMRDDPDVEVLAQRLAAEIAVSKTMEKILLARRAILAGMREPNVANNVQAQTELEKLLTIIDREISQVKLEMDMQKAIMSNTANVIFQNKQNREANSGSHSNSVDSQDKRIYDLQNGAPSQQEMEEPRDINIPSKMINLDIPTASNVAPYLPSFFSSGSSGSSTYSPITAITGTALEQATGLLRNFEGFSSTAYWDVNAYRTGYGSDTITLADGTVVKVTKDTVVTQADAERDLQRRSQIFANTARRQVSTSTWNSLPPNVQAALTSYAYNYGSLTSDVVTAARQSASSGDMTILATAVRNRQTNNNGVNARRRNQEADYILGTSS
ncbi:integrating conjugative element protein [Caviibacterium pharyngocola]|uniref:Lysozyme n=1 Tax=Caviibacterium pharyngocola TaxID=28159 RepID=A0A2M8RV76_9PAST|nr:integrating conjugative element protein [Caviibacterium pharyngocola]PJG82789.1 integrating conjugative element protein [Caviibacterium pharyngocola]